MGNDLNNVDLIGRLTRDIEIKNTANSMVGKISLAVNRSYRRQDGSVQEDVSYVDVVMWGESCERLQQYLTKGRQVAVNGEIRQERWEQDGASYQKIVVASRRLQLLGMPQNAQREPDIGQNRATASIGGNARKSQQQEPVHNPRQPAQSQRTARQAPPPPVDPGYGYYDEDIPF